MFFTFYSKFCPKNGIGARFSLPFCGLYNSRPELVVSFAYGIFVGNNDKGNDNNCF